MEAWHSLNHLPGNIFLPKHEFEPVEPTGCSSDSSDIIECSIMEIQKESSPIKKCIFPRTLIKVAPTSNVNESTRKNGSANAVKESLRLSLKKKFQLLSAEEKTKCEGESPVLTPTSRRDYCVSSTQKRLYESLTNDPEDLPYLSRTKLRNIKLWLEKNDLETVRTPPFSNLSVTSVSSGKKPLSKRRITRQREKTDGDCSMDSDVEGVLKAVYGSDWIVQNVKCQTEPKSRPALRRSSVGIRSTARKPRRGSARSLGRSFSKCCSASETKCDVEDGNGYLEDSIISGVEMINLDESETSSNCLNSNVCRTDFEIVKGKGKNKSHKSTMWSPSKEVHFSGRTRSRTQGKRPNVTAAAGPGRRERETEPAKTQKKTFLASLSVSTPTSKCHPDADFYKINYTSKKDELARKLYKLYNGEVFDGRLPDDMSFSWNVKLRGTAGYCYNKRITKSTGEILRVSRIEFSSKIVDRADRLRDTMIHELCHAASWIVNGKLDGHGSVWNAWAAKALNRFPELPRIRRCHNYEIMAKYTYRCTGCGYSVKRHSKSIDIERKRCGHCFGTLELLLNKKRKGKTEVPEFDATRTLRTPNKFALFVKENYRNVKASNATAKHSEIMKILSAKYASAKTLN